MDISTMGTVLAIVVITYLIGLLCKSVGSIRDELIPVIVGAAGGVLGIFPEGTRHKEGIMEHVESGVALIALRSGVPMIPLYIGAPVPPSGRARRRPDCDGRPARARREPRHLRGAARPHHRNLPRADGTPGGVNTKICVKS